MRAICRLRTGLFIPSYAAVSHRTASSASSSSSLQQIYEREMAHKRLWRRDPNQESVIKYLDRLKSYLEKEERERDVIDGKSNGSSLLPPEKQARLRGLNIFAEVGTGKRWLTPASDTSSWLMLCYMSQGKLLPRPT
jgi:predicted ATPase